MITIKINIAKANITKKNVKQMKEHLTSISNELSPLAVTALTLV